MIYKEKNVEKYEYAYFIFFEKKYYEPNVSNHLSNFD